MYVRVKRRNQTVFLHVEPSQTFGMIKSRLAENFSVDAAGILLFANDKKRELLDLATISDQEIKTDDVIYMVFQKETGGGWEDIQVDTLVPLAEATAETS